MKSIQQLCVKYGCDKTPELGHLYAPIYDELFKGQLVSDLLEIGVGYKGLMEQYVPSYTTGASLRVWRDYFPAAWIWGLDKHPEAMVIAERISTILGDSRDPEVAAKFFQEFDIIIDDGSHRRSDQLRTALNFLPKVKAGGLYIIEDVPDYQYLVNGLVDYKLELLSDVGGDRLVLIRL